MELRTTKCCCLYLMMWQSHIEDEHTAWLAHCCSYTQINFYTVIPLFFIVKIFVHRMKIIVYENFET